MALLAKRKLPGELKGSQPRAPQKYTTYSTYHPLCLSLLNPSPPLISIFQVPSQGLRVPDWFLPMLYWHCNRKLAAPLFSFPRKQKKEPTLPLCRPQSLSVSCSADQGTQGAIGSDAFEREDAGIKGTPYFSLSGAFVSLSPVLLCFCSVCALSTVHGTQKTTLDTTNQECWVGWGGVFTYALGGKSQRIWEQF